MVGLLEGGRHERVFVAIAMMAFISVTNACRVANVPTVTPQTPIEPTGIMSRIPPENPLTSYNAEPTELLISETPSPSIASPSPPVSTASPSRTLTATPEVLTGQIVLNSWREDVNKDGYINGYDGAQLYILTLASGELNQLTDAGYYDRSPVWSPDGERVAFISDRGGNDDLYVIDIGSHELIRLTDTVELEWSPAWSPDGTQIAFQRTSEIEHGLEEVHLFVLTISDGSVEQLTNQPNNDYTPDWSPDGQYIAFTREGPVVEGDKTLYGSMVYLKKLDTGEEIRLTEGRYDPGNTTFSNPKWPSCTQNDYLSLEQVPGQHNSGTIFLFKLDWESSPPRLSKLVGINGGVEGPYSSYTWADCVKWLISPVVDSSLTVLRANSQFPKQQFTNDLVIQASPLLSMDDGWLLTEGAYYEDWPDWKP